MSTQIVTLDHGKNIIRSLDTQGKLEGRPRRVEVVISSGAPLEPT